MKKLNCAQKISHQNGCDLYINEDPTPVPPPPPNWPPVWPLPAAFTNGSTIVAVSPALTFAITGLASTAIPSTLTKAFARYKKLMFPHNADGDDGGVSITNVSVSVASEGANDNYPQMNTDESYSLSIPADGSAISISAKTVYGALHGLETLSQLVVFDFNSASYSLAGAPWKIDDAPRFPHRGLMIDSSRHFLPLSVIRKLLDSLPYTKMNVLHWVSAHSKCSTVNHNPTKPVTTCACTCFFFSSSPPLHTSI
jgi:hexosaminidase